jgi:hypothetical protein
MTQENFTSGLHTLFTGDFNNLCEIIFNIYDYDQDNRISKDDISVVLSYIPLNTINDININTLHYEK